MKTLTEPEIRASFVNCSKGEAKRLPLPRDLAERPWDDLDFLGWRDPGAPDRCYIVAEHEGRLIGVTLRLSNQARGLTQRSMCSLCLTTHSGNGVALMTARRTGQAGRQGNSVGAYLCTDLACSLYTRDKKAPEPGGRLEETLTPNEKIARTQTNLTNFLKKITT
ncbi:FBP domain-containing protein [Actinomadura kijaniata]|uniref:FBP domain-containing protein n=1 Tax=Actinomadura kijaniata TaxID=46161 RepID=UPI00082D89F5|nr:FBP domain-containing protein [Actinomadura kijaniata]